MANLKGTVAVVTGASRGVGRGVAIGLGEAGATIYLTGRTQSEGDSELPGSLESTAQAVSAEGGEARPVRCDHSRDEEVEDLFRRVDKEVGHIDVLVNSAWGGYRQMESFHSLPFWEQPRSRWDDMFRSGARAAFVASALAAKSMVRTGSGLIVNISAAAAKAYQGNVTYGASKAATDRMSSDMATELAGHGVTVFSLYPGLVRTENVMQYAEHFDLSNSQSPQFLGRVVAALAADPDVAQRSGQVLVAAAVAREYGVREE